MAVLGQALVDHLGHPAYASLVRERVCKPLALRDTVVVPDPHQAERLARGHGRRNRPIEPWHLLGLAGAGALRSTAENLLAYLRAHLRPDHTPLAEALVLTQHEWHRSRLAGGMALARMRWPVRAAHCSSTAAPPEAAMCSLPSHRKPRSESSR